MLQLEILLEATGPVLLGAGLAQGNVQSSRKCVAGSVWRGAIASAILDELGQRRHNGRAVAASSPDPLFAQIFCEDTAARFGFLYPVRAKAEEAKGYRAFPVPLTAWHCKLYPGFEGHGVCDGLLNRLRETAMGKRPYARATDVCPSCSSEEGGRLERMRGFAARTALDGQRQYVESRVEPRSFVRVGLNRSTETAQDQVLYVLDALTPGPGGEGREPPLTFVGSWWGTEQQETTLRQLLDQSLLSEVFDDKQVYRLQIGTARSRGMGAARLQIGTTQTPSSVAERLDSFQPMQDGHPLDPNHLYAALTLRSPLQLLDRRGLPTTRITVEVLHTYCASIPQDLEILVDYSVLERETWSGWSGAWGLPKPVAPAVAAGSVIVLRSPTSQRNQLLALLKAIEANGLGEHRAEGWGEVLVCDSFHVDFDEAR